MITLFIFKSNARGMQYGIGTYIRELTASLLKCTDIEIFIINYHSINCREFVVKNVTSGLLEVSLPSPKVKQSESNTYQKYYSLRVVDLLSELIENRGEVLFLMNYIDDLPLIESLKNRYSYAIISMVHFSQSQQLFNGNMQRLKGLNIDNPSNNIEYTLLREKELYMNSDHIISVTKYM